jgi:catechol 2,3-dioxygenase-like lactoylglutathione lyase family enzyme
MGVQRIDHINIAASAHTVQKCVAFYVDVLGLKQGYRPPFTSRGVWLYADDAPIVHLSETNADAPPNIGPLNHVAFACENIDSIRGRLVDQQLPFRVDGVPASHQVQIFVRDPAGVQVELNFRD